MRIISGKYKGRTIDGYNIIGTRPTMDRVKESLIAIIQNKLEDSVCLDLFAGSGSIGLEFLSNGAKKCFFVDQNRKSISTLKKNIINLKVKEETFFLQCDFRDALKKFKNEDIKFDIVFLDPPYELNLINPSLELIEEYDLLNEDAIVICEYEKENIDNLTFSIYKSKKYGSKSILILKKIS